MDIFLGSKIEKTTGFQAHQGLAYSLYTSYIYIYIKTLVCQIWQLFNPSNADKNG